MELVSLDSTKKTPEVLLDPEGKIGTLPRFLLKIAGLFIKLVREVKEVAYQGYVDWEVDSSKFESRYDIKATNIREGMKKTIKWYKDNQENSE